MRPFSMMTCLILVLKCTVSFGIDRSPEAHTGVTARELVRAESLMVATANPYASRAALKILRRGGNAVDAAITASLVLNLVEPQSSGIGGGSFLLYWDQGHRTLHSYDGRETAPQKAKPDLFFDKGKPLSFSTAVAGGRAVGVPGQLKSLELVHNKHGKLAWADLFTDPIRLAEEGFIVSPRLDKLIRGKARARLFRSPEARGYFFPDNTPIKAGQRLRNTELADTFRKIAHEGSDAFYNGELARKIVETVATDANPGLLTINDIKRYGARERTPVCGPFYGSNVCGMGPPSSGGISLLQMLAILEELGIDREIPQSPQTIHLFAQAGRLAFADRAVYIADPDFVQVPVAGLLHQQYLNHRTLLVDPLLDKGRTDAGTPEDSPQERGQTGFNPEQPGTTHISIVDGDGNGVSLTASIEQAFGSGLMVGGFLLNNELTDFSFAWKGQDGEEIANRVEGGKRPRSSMAPTMVFTREGDLKLIIGSPGGSRIIPYVAQSLLALLVWNQDVQTAVSLPHFTHLNGETLDLEKDTELEQTSIALKRRGYRVHMRTLNSGLQAVLRTASGLEGGTDPRREGLVLGDGAQSRTTSSLSMVLKDSAPSSVTNTSSSILTPFLPGR